MIPKDTEWISRLYNAGPYPISHELLYTTRIVVLRFYTLATLGSDSTVWRFNPWHIYTPTSTDYNGASYYGGLYDS